MAELRANDPWHSSSTRRGFLGSLGSAAAAGAGVGPLLSGARAAASEPIAAAGAEGRVKQRVLGKTGLKVSEIGFGGHSWAYQRIPDGRGGFRSATVDEAVEMIAAGLDMGVNFLDACTPTSEHTVPGEALRRLKKRDQVIVSARLCHKQKGVPQDKQEVYKFLDERLKLWQIDHFDLLMLSNEVKVTELSGYWDMEYSIEALEKVKQQGKIRFAGFGSHFTPELFLRAFRKYGKYFDVCSIPYNIRHRAAEEVLPAAEKLSLGVVTIKPFARGELLKDRDVQGADAGLPRDMLAFVLENPLVDVCICGVHTLAQVKENFSASWTKLSPAAKERLNKLALGTPCRTSRWLEEGWLYA